MIRVIQLIDRWSSGGVPNVVRSIEGILNNQGISNQVIVYKDKDEDGPISMADIRRTRSRIFSIEDDMLIIHDHFGGLASIAYLLGMQKPNVRTVFHMHNDPEPISSSPDKRRRFKRAIFNHLLLPKFDLCIGISRYVLDKYPKTKRSMVLYNPESHAEFLPEITKIKSEEVHIACLGRVVYEKGFDTLPELVAELRSRGISAVGHIAGEGDFLPVIHSKAQRFNVEERIKFHGRVNDPMQFLQDKDLMLFSSRQEPFGLTITEAFRAGIPILCIYPENGGGHMEWLRDGLNCVLEYRFVSSLADAVQKVISNSDFRTSIVEGGRKTLEMFAEQKYGEKLLSAYHTLLPNQSSEIEFP